MASKLNDQEKVDIYNFWKNQGLTKTGLAEAYDVSTRTIDRAIKSVQSTLGFTEEEPENQEVVDDLEEPIEEGQAFYQFQASKEAITITKITDDAVTPSVVYKDQPQFADVSSLIQAAWNTGSDEEEQKILQEAYDISSVKQYLETFSQGAIKVYPEQNRVTYKLEDVDQEYDFHGKLVTRLLEGVKEHGPEGVQGLVSFANHLANNPSNRAVNELYEFLEAMDIKITQEGMVECYKKVTEDFKDCFTGKIDNSVGQTVEVARNMVDEDSNRTCSHGLHVCSYSYLDSYPGKVILKVLVNPADFVSIPSDYYSMDGNGDVKAKARVCKYYVDRDVSNEYSRFLR